MRPFTLLGISIPLSISISFVLLFSASVALFLCPHTSHECPYGCLPHFMQITRKHLLGAYHETETQTHRQCKFMEGKRKTLSKLSIVPEGSRMIFQKRDQLKIPLYQNTYRLEPFRAYNAEAVDKIVYDVLESKLSSLLIYHPDYASKLSMETAADVLRAVNRKDYDRRKVVVQVTIVQRMRQSVHTAFQCLWDTGRDNYSYHSFENSHIYAWCCVFGLYYE